MKPPDNELVAQMRSAFGESLVSVVAYGSAIDAPGNAKPADHLTMVVAKWLGANELNKARPAAHWWIAQGFPLPVFLTEKEFNDSLDVFAIEFRQMKRAYRVLYGADLLANREAAKTNLRQQVEYELRGKLLRLRSLYVPMGDSTSKLTRLMTDSVVSFIRYMRPILEILSEAPPLGRRAVVQRISERLALDLSPLTRILRLRDEPVDLMAVEAQDLFAAYVDCISRVIEAVDQL
jgi:hypothetical protein